MASYYEELISKYEIENPLYKTIAMITNYIKNSHDYESAIKIIIDNNLKMEDIVSCTSRLTKEQIVELATRLISIYK